MGSNSSNSSIVSYENNFVHLENCEHSGYNKYTKQIYLKRIPLFDSKTDQAIKTGRILTGIITAGLTEAGYGIYKGATGAGDGVNHYFLEMNFECFECQKLKKEKLLLDAAIKTYTIEFTEENKFFVPGYYTNGEKRDQKNGCWSYKEIEYEFNCMKADYDITNWNCSHFAKMLFEKL